MIRLFPFDFLLVLLVWMPAISEAWLSLKVHKLPAVERRKTMTMRDGSTAAIYFSVGDTVCVTTDVIHTPPPPSPLSSFSSRGLIGRVKEIWSKCDVDPACCCAGCSLSNLSHITSPSSHALSTFQPLTFTNNHASTEQVFEAPIEVEFENDMFYGKEKLLWTGHFAVDEITKIHDTNK